VFCTPFFVFRAVTMSRDFPSTKKKPQEFNPGACPIERLCFPV
jgi:hypothetical protein